MIEMTVAMAVMTTLLAMLTAGIVGLYRSANNGDAILNVQSQLHLAFQRLDTQIRYASSISIEGTAPGTNDWYVEYLSNVSGAPVCGQLRLTAGGVLQQRTWARDDTLTDFATIATGLSAAHPFTRIAAGTNGYTTDRLLVTVSATSGPSAAARQISVSLAALNSSSDTSDDTTCSEGRPT